MPNVNISDAEMNMLDADQCQLPGQLTLDCRMNILNVHALQKSIYLSESQKRLMLCLMNNVHCKRKIIKIVWHECHQRIRDNNYHQLVYQFRNTLTRNQLPTDLLVTIPHRGLVLNTDSLTLLSHREENRRRSTGKDGQHQKSHDTAGLLKVLKNIFLTQPKVRT